MSYLSGELPWKEGCLRAYGTGAHCVIIPTESEPQRRSSVHEQGLQ